MSNLHCQICGEAAGHIEGSQLVVYSHSATHSVQLNVDEIQPQKEPAKVVYLNVNTPICKTHGAKLRGGVCPECPPKAA